MQYLDQATTAIVCLCPLFQAELRHKKTVTEDVVREAERRTREIKDTLRNNESYKQIVELEDKLDHVKKEYKMIAEQLESAQQEFDYATPKKAAQETLSKVMEILRAP